MNSKLLWIKDRFFPIGKEELLKFFLLSSICFLVCLSYTILRNLKETLIITNSDLGIQVIPFLRTWLLMPVLLLFVKCYASLSSRIQQAKVFYCLISVFLLYFVLYIYLLCPHEKIFQLDTVGDWLSPIYPPLTKPLGEIIRHWIHSIYYCLSEVWGTIVVLILFWGTCNRLTNMSEARRLYGPMIFISNFSGIIAAWASLYISNGSVKWFFFPSLSNWNATVSMLTLVVCVATTLILVLFYALNRVTSQSGAIKEDLVPKKEMSLISIIRTMAKNQKFWPLAIMISAYFFSTGILDLVWKYYLHKVCPDSNQFNDFLNHMTGYIGIISTILALFVTGNLIRKFNWTVTALITPVLLLIPLTVLLINGLIGESNPLYFKIGSIAGASYYCLNRICKYTFFDPSKEIACVEFSYSEQIKAKTVLDGIMPKMAKISEATVLQFMLILFSGFGSLIPSILVILLAAHLVWVFTIPIWSKRLFVKEPTN